MLIAGDLHLEKGSSYAARGQLLPPYDTRATLDRLEAEIMAFSPRTVVLLGDSFHDARAVARLAPDDAKRISVLGRGLDLIWAVGNHDDEGLAAFGPALPGRIADQIAVAGLTLRHEPLAGLQPGEVSGHLHPCAKIVSRGRGVRRRAFLTDGSRLILPAFGAYAGGLNACDEAFAGLFDRPPLAGVLGDGQVHPIAYTALCGD
jgi:DNA ligase-associated metallophosphoesterase